MSDDIMIPTSYEQWRHCIEVQCKIRLTQDYVGKRLSQLQDGNHARTREFERLYGSEHLQRTITWFRRASNELSGKSGGNLRA